MKQVQHMPETGQFILISDYDGDQWAATFRYIDGVLNFFNTNDDEFVVFKYQNLKDFSSNNVKYFVFDGEK